MTVHRKLMEARVRLLNTELKKSGLNKFAGYSYFELGDFIPAIQTIFHDLGLCGVVSYKIDYAELSIVDIDDGTVIVITSPISKKGLTAEGTGVGPSNMSIAASFKAVLNRRSSTALAVPSLTTLL